jgi:hypothetical protein
MNLNRGGQGKEFVVMKFVGGMERKVEKVFGNHSDVTVNKS